MKTLLSAVLLAGGLMTSTVTLADEAAQPAATTNASETPAPTTVDTTAADAPAAATTTTDSAKKMNKADAEKACKDDGKTGVELKACITDKMNQ